MMKKYISKQKGFTLTELLAVIIIGSIIIVAAAIGISVFFKKHRELSRFAELQNSTYEVLTTIKKGVLVGSSDDVAYLGMASASKFAFPESSGSPWSSIKCEFRSDRSFHENDNIEFMLDRWNYVIKYRYRYGSTSSPTRRLFPKEEDSDIKVTKFEFRPVINRQNRDVVSFEIEAEMKITEDETKKVAFETIISRIKMVSGE